VQGLDADGLRAHAAATGPAPPWGLGLELGDDLRARAFTSTLAYNERRFVPGRDGRLDDWLRPQAELIDRAGLRYGGAMLSLRDLDLRHQPGQLRDLLAATLPGVGWPPSALELNTTGHSDRGEPPEPSTSLRVSGRILWPALGASELPYPSTVALLLPIDVPGWRAVVTGAAAALGLALREP
jgi:hypothetical protein